MNVQYGMNVQFERNLQSEMNVHHGTSVQYGTNGMRRDGAGAPPLYFFRKSFKIKPLKKKSTESLLQFRTGRADEGERLRRRIIPIFCGVRTEATIPAGRTT